MDPSAELSPEQSQAGEMPETVEEAVTRFQDDDSEAAISFLRDNKREVGEFCMQIRDKYADNDTATPFLRLAKLIEELL